MSLSYTDPSANQWSISSYGQVDVTRASRTLYDTGSSLSLYAIDGSTVTQRYLSYGTASSATATHSVTGTATGVSVRRDAAVLSDTSGRHFLRLVETVTNTGIGAATFRLDIGDNMYADGSTRLLTTSSGDASYTTADSWYATDNSSYYTGYPVTAHVVGGGRPTAGASRTSTDVFSTTYNVTLGAGESASIVHFVAVGATQADATAMATNLSTLPSYALSGMPSSQLDSIINYAIDVTSAVTTTLASYQKDLTLTGTAPINGTGNSMDNVLIGNAADNTLTGLGGNDTLIGFDGADVMIGGAGDDLYYLNSSADTVTEANNEGVDTVVSTIDYSLSGPGRAYVENLTLIGGVATLGIGNAADNLLRGNGLNNALYGLDGNDTLSGGAGVDTLNGGAGDDTYIVDSTTDVIVDSAGNDTVQSLVSFSLASHAAIERLELLGNAAIDATGNASANVLVGNDAANRLNGGAGADIMSGRGGNDVYIVDNVGDTIIEAADGGTELVYSNVHHTLSDNVEWLALQGGGNINGIGNALDNIIAGNAGNNVLRGMEGNDTLNGGGGVDALQGGVGDDLYVVDSATDVISDEDGIDTVQSGVSQNLGWYTGVENLILTGAANINGIGNGQDNVILANAGNNVLDGGGGNDTVDYSAATSAVTVTLNNTGAQATGGSGTDVLRNIENVRGTAFNDRLFGNGANNTLEAGEGNDTLFGGGGDDGLIGGAGDDLLIDYIGDDVMNGGAGNDVFKIAGTNGSVLIEDSAGVDTLDVSGATAGVHVDLAPGATSNINGRMVTLAAGGEVDVPLDVLFLQDCSGSFGDDVSTVTNMVPELVSTLSGIQPDIRFGLASFIDKGEYVYRTDLAMTSNQSALVSALNGLAIGSGGDTPESQIEALMHAAIRTSEVGFRSNSLRVAVVMTDADFHVAGDTYYTANDGDAIAETEDYPTLALLKTKLLEGGVIPIFAVAGSAASSYQTLVDYLGFGTVVPLASDSSNLVSVLSTGVTDITEARIENVIGSAHNDVLIGNALINTLTGGAGNDTYYVQNVEDRVVEGASGGTELVMSWSSFSLSANVENLTLLGVENINATGNADANQLVGNAGNNTLDGGAGADRMLGGRGDDVYNVDNVGDKVIEYRGNGVDTVISSVGFTLGNNVENLTLIGGTHIHADGNAANNVINGNNGNNRINGGGGADTMAGGAGHDTYIVDDIGDVVVEGLNAGTDLVLSSATHTLSANVDWLNLIGSSNINGTGNSLDNRLIGNAGNNTLSGGGGADTLTGGAGTDVLTGGTGNDVFRYNAASEGGDTITDFNSTYDRLEFANTAFGTLGAGALSASRFEVQASGSTASGTAIRFVFNQADSGLYYDSDGLGGAASTRIATLQGVSTLSSSAIQIA